MKDKVLCQQCHKEGKKSKVFPYQMPYFGFNPPYYDEEGNLQVPDVNLWISYCCSNGHIWYERSDIKL